MERFKRLLKSKSEAVQIFEQAKKNLHSVIAKYHSHNEESQRLVLAKQAEIEAELQAQKFAHDEIQAASRTIEKIDLLLN